MFATVQSPTISQTLSSIPRQTAAPFSFPAPLSAHNVNLPARQPSEMTASKDHSHPKPQYPQTPTNKRHTNIYPHTHHHHHNQPHEQHKQEQQHQPFSSPIFAPPPFSSPPQPSTNTTTYATRYLATIHNPAGRIASRALSRGTRRDAFLSRIRRVREESAFERRAEQMLGSECARERREFLEWMERCAPEIGFEGDIGGEDGDGDGDEAALEEFLSDEMMFQAYVERMEQAQQSERARGSMAYDDDDYDDLFANLASRDNGGQIHSHDDAMDTSLG